ncbi:MAG TPA: hypothetical protein ENK91_13195, partial [Bacteroidetes bacterium]|nr:hypothetical protein [Bacteroidota bacterium]
MKKVIFKSALLAVVSVAMMATTSQALTITAFDAETNQTNIINDNGTGDINALEGMITTNNFFMGGWDFSNVTATSTPIIGTESDPVLNAFSINTNYLGQDGDLTLTVADDFT